MFENWIEKLKKVVLKKHSIAIALATFLLLIISVTQSVIFATGCLILIVAGLIIWKLSSLLFKKSKLAFIAVLALIATTLYCKITLYPQLEREGFFWSAEEKYFYQKIEEFKKSGKKEIMIKNLTNFEWENVCSSWAYSGISDPNFRNLEFDKKLPDDDDEGKYTLIFVSNGVGRVFVINKVGNYPLVITGLCQNKNEALLKINN